MINPTLIKHTGMYSHTAFPLIGRKRVKQAILQRLKISSKIVAFESQKINARRDDVFIAWKRGEHSFEDIYSIIKPQQSKVDHTLGRFTNREWKEIKGDAVA